jgi:hypothetical protein
MIHLLLAAAVMAAPAPDSMSTGPVLAQLRAKDQALLDAIAPGDRGLWERTLSADAIYVDENGEVFDRAKFLGEIKPLPAGASGHISIAAYDGVVHGNVALIRMRGDERELFHGAALHADYLMTETWLRQGAEWKLAMVHAYVVAVDPPAVALEAKVLDGLVGRYVFADLSLTVRREGDHLAGAQGTGPARPLLAETADVLFQPGRPRVRWIVERDAAGRVTRLINRREGEDMAWIRAAD